MAQPNRRNHQVPDKEGKLTPTPDWAQLHIEILETPGFHDDCFRSSQWTLYQSTVSESFTNTNDITGDYATMNVTEGATVNGAGWRRDISPLNLATNDYPLTRFRLRGRGTTPQYKVEIEYTDSSSTTTGWTDAATEFTAKNLQLVPGKTIKYLKIHARSNTPNQSAQIDYDYLMVLQNPPLIPHEVTMIEADLISNTAVSSLTIKHLNDPRLSSTQRLYTLDENQGTVTYDLSYNKHKSSLINTIWSPDGKHGNCIHLQATSNSRLETGFKPTIPADGALTICFWVKASPGATNIVAGFGQTDTTWNRIQFNWSSNKLRLYVRDDNGNTLQYTTTATIADNNWHHITGLINPQENQITLIIDGKIDGAATGTLNTITIDNNDLTFGCLHNDSGYSNYTTAYIDQIRILDRTITPDEAYQIATQTPPSGASRAKPGNTAMLYIAAQSENLVYKLFTGRIIDKITSGDPDHPQVTLICEDLGEIIHERNYTKEYLTPTQISTIIDDIIDNTLPELYLEKDTTNRAIKNNFRDEGVWSLLEKLAEAATYPTGETGANFYTDPGGALRFKPYGAFTCTHNLSDGSDGNTPNIQQIQVSESIKSNPKLANDIKIIIYEAEHIPTDQDSYTESADKWSSPDPTDSGYPQSDTGDKQRGTASIHYNTTNPGQIYRMRLELTEIDLTGIDELNFIYKYGSGLSPETLEVRLQKSSWLWTSDYLIKTGITPGASATWNNLTIKLNQMTKTGNPGNIIDHLEIRMVTTQPDLGTGGFLIDHLRFTRSEKAGTATDTTSQTVHGKRTYRKIDKTITDLDYADYLAENILLHRSQPITTIQTTTPGRAQPGYRPPMHIQVTSHKDGLKQATFQIQRARHHYTPDTGYTCTLTLTAIHTNTGTYDPNLAPNSGDLGLELGEWRRRQQEAELNTVPTPWK